MLATTPARNHHSHPLPRPSILGRHGRCVWWPVNLNMPSPRSHERARLRALPFGVRQPGRDRLQHERHMELCPTTLAPRVHAVGIMWRHGAIFACAIHIILAVLIVRAARRARSTSTRQTVKTRAQIARPRPRFSARSYDAPHTTHTLLTPRPRDARGACGQPMISYIETT